MIMTVLMEKRIKRFPQSGYHTLVALPIFSLMFTILVLVVVSKEMDNMKPQRLSSQRRNGSHKAHVQIGFANDMKIKNEENSKNEIILRNFMSKGDVNQQEGKSSEQLISYMISLLIKILKSLRRGEDYFINNNIVGRLVAGFLSEFVLQRYKLPWRLMFTIIILIIACLGYVFISFADLAAGSLTLYVALAIIGISVSFRTQWPKSLTSFLVCTGLHLLNRKWRDREIRLPNHFHCSCGYVDLKKKASVLTRNNVAKGRWFVVFVCFLIMSTAQGTSMRVIYSETQSALTNYERYISEYAPIVHLGHADSETVLHTPLAAFKVGKHGATGDGKHSTQRSVTTMGTVVKGWRSLLENGKSKPTKPNIYRGPPAQHN